MLSYEEIFLPSWRHDSASLNRARGCLLGLAIGDAVGTSVEFSPRGSFSLVTDMLGGGPFGLKAGEWTDDTSMALCLASSLLDADFDLMDQAKRYVRWYRDGYMSSTGRCFDIGATVRDSLHRFESSGKPDSGSTHPSSAGNGCIMRLAPVPIFYANDIQLAAQNAIEQSKVTHACQECLEASHLFARILVRALRGVTDKAELLRVSGKTFFTAYDSKIRAIGACEYFDLDAQDILRSGYVVDSLEAALWCFYMSDSFHDAILRAVNLGDDADTTAAITGQIAGAYYGERSIPEAWRKKLVMGDQIAEIAGQLWIKSK